MDFDDQWRHPRLGLRLYVPLTGLLVVGGRFGGRNAVNALGWHVGAGALLALARVSSHVEMY